MLKHQYEMFTIEDHESIQSMVSRLQVILNNLRSVGSTVSQYEINDKILRIFYLLNGKLKKLLSEILKFLRSCPWKNW